MARKAPELVMGGRVFLLSPANLSGKRAQLLQNPYAVSAVARKLRNRGGAELGEVFSFVSSLYFRGKLAYARAFARPPLGAAGAYVITPADGLRPPEAPIRLNDLRRYTGIPVDPEEERYRVPLLRDLHALAPVWAEAEIVLLGSIASPKYTEILTSVLGARLLFPADFIGRGDMSRGGLLLRSARDGKELSYIAVLGANRRGARPPRLPPLKPRRGNRLG